MQPPEVNRTGQGLRRTRLLCTGCVFVRAGDVASCE